MSLLLLDVGNTRLKWALWDDQFKQIEAIVHEDDPVAVFARSDWPRVEQVWIACVPRLRDEARWREAVHNRCGLDPHIVISPAQWKGLNNAYAEPHKLGVDRWLSMAALWNERWAPFCVVGAGTALTFDRVDGQGQHLGGLIAPGLGSAQQSLLQVTVTLSSPTAASAYHQGLGQHSEEAIRQGSFFAARGVIEHALRAPHADAREQRFITGGDAETLLPHLGEGWTHRPHLVLEGLLALARDGA